MSDWKECKLGDIALVIPGYAFKGKDFGSNGYPVVKIGDINPPIVDLSNCMKIPDEKVNGLDKFKLQQGDFVLAMTGATLGKVGRYYSQEIGYLNQRVAKFENKSGLSDKKFLYYLITNSQVSNEIINRGLGSAQPNISGRDIESIIVDVPSLSTQTAIAEILSSLDDKIELNNKINQELENLAQTLFKQWFIDFEFPNENGEPYKSSGGEMVDSELGEIPKGWEIGRFSDLVKISTGKGINKKDYLNDGSYPIIGANGIMGYCANYNIEGFKILTGRVGTLGTVRICNEKAWTSDNVLICEPIYVEVNHYSYFVMKDFDYKSLNRGSTQPLITQTDLKIQSIVSPPKNILFPFQSQMDCFLSILESNILENNFLTNLRDTLLPKLISGVLGVSMQTLRPITDIPKKLSNEL